MSDQRNGGIAWTDQTWNPVRGCSRVSPGCVNCYAETMAARFSEPGQPYEGLARRTESGEARWTGEVQVARKHLTDPLRWRRVRRIFVNSMSDLFHEALSDHDIDEVFAVMWACLFIGRGEACVPGHTFQVLTKRAHRMRDYMLQDRRSKVAQLAGAMCEDADAIHDQVAFWKGPHPRIWLGVSVEDQQRFDERWPDLEATPAVVRFLSIEPQVANVVLSEAALHGRFLECPDETQDEATDPCLGCDGVPRTGQRGGDPCGAIRGPKVDWVIVGGESGPGARPFDVAWARSLVAQCQAAGTSVFVKQLGSRPEHRYCGDCGGVEAGGHQPDRTVPLKLRDRKGADPSEWPADLQVQQWPGEAAP